VERPRPAVVQRTATRSGPATHQALCRRVDCRTTCLSPTRRGAYRRTSSWSPAGRASAHGREIELHEQRHFSPSPAPDHTLRLDRPHYLLHQHRVSWDYYLSAGTEPDCEDDEAVCPSHPQYRPSPDTGTRCTTSLRCSKMGSSATFSSLRTS